MAQGDVQVTVIGNLTDAPELRRTPAGAAVASFTVASTPRVFDRQTNDYRDGETLYLRCSIWRDPAQNTADSYVRGQRVLVVGRLRQRSFEVEGQKRTVVEMEVDEMGPSTRYGVTKFEKRSGSGGSDGNRQPAYATQSSDPWGNPATAAQDEEPF